MNTHITNQGHGSHARVANYIMGVGHFCVNEVSGQELIDDILEWAEKHPSFDTDFVDSMQDALHKYGRLTENQEEALKRIARRWHIYR